MTNPLSKTILLTALTVWLAATLAVATTGVERRTALPDVSHSGVPLSPTAEWPRER